MKRTRIVLATALTWGAAFLLDQGWRIYAVLNGPPSSDEYANTLGFQIAASVFVLLIMWLPSLILVIGVELLVFAAIDRIRRGKEAGAAGVPPNNSLDRTPDA